MSMKDFFLLAQFSLFLNSPSDLLVFNEKNYLKAVDQSTESCNYDLDDVDMQWLESISSIQTLKKGNRFPRTHTDLNTVRSTCLLIILQLLFTATSIDALTMERAITWFEREVSYFFSPINLLFIHIQ